MTDGNRKLLKFPCDFPIKVMGRVTDRFEADVLRVFEQHIDLERAKVTTRPSSSGNFLSVTVLFRAESQQQLDDLYRDLNEREEVLFCL